MNTYTHLTDAQFTELLSGVESPELLHHVQGCAGCGAELERVRSAVESFNRVTMAWAQRQSVGIQVPVAPERRWFAIPTWSMAGGLAAVLAVAGLAAGVHVERSHQEAAPVVEVATGPTEAAVSEDNRLMMAIDSELRQTETAVIPAAELGRAQSRSKQGLSRRAEN